MHDTVPPAYGPPSDGSEHKNWHKGGYTGWRGQAGPPRVSPRLLRRSRTRRRHGREAPRLARAARLRSQADRPQRPRRPRPRGSRRDLRRGRARRPEGRTRGPFGPRCGAFGVRERPGTGPEHDRRDLPARDQGARPGPPLRSRRVHGPADRPRRARGGRRDDGRSAGVDDPRPVGRGRGGPRPAGRREGGVHHADDALGRRDGRDHHGPPPSLPAHPRAEEGGHLLRDLQPAVGREGSAQGGRPLARDRLEKLVELEPARRGRARARGRRAADRRRDATSTRRGSRRPRRSGSPPGRRRRRSSSIGSATGSGPAGVDDISAHRLVEEDVEFRLPVELRRELALAETQA